jgi:large subunit ribosomal protein L3
VTTFVGSKLGMSRIYLESGVVVPVTLIKVYESIVSDFRECSDKNFNQVTISYGKDSKTEKRIDKPVLGFYRKRNLEAYNSMRTFKVGKDVRFAIGDNLMVDRLSQNEKVNISGLSKGKGFAGAVKRFGFRGQLAQHGSSLSHRSLGGTGSRRREGKVFKGKKMAGHMGSEKVTIKNLEIIEVKNENAIICVRGAVPGSRGTELIITTRR